MKKEIRKRKAALHNLGCKVNSYETEAMAQMLAQAGYELVDFTQEADVYIVNTCSVTNIADRKSRQMLHRARSKNPDAVIVATGCYVQTAGEELEKDAGVDIVIGNNKKAGLLPLLERFFSEKRRLSDVIDINDGAQDYEELGLLAGGSHTRAFLKVQDGCNQFCSYCIIPFARGRVRSRSGEDICKEIEGLAKKGCCEFVLTGIHISSYGMDFKEKTSLLDLILQIRKIEGVKRIRLGSLEPRIVTEEFAKALGGIEEICPHFHLSLQSGCDETLKRMNRHYTAAEYKDGVDRLRKYFDAPAITTDVIVGFPGETDEEFARTEAFLRETGFFEMHIFPYSAREGTVAAKMKGQVPGEIKKSRSRRLLELEREQSVQYRRQFVGCEETVLFEETKVIGGQPYQVGHTARYVKAAKKTDDDLAGRMVQGRITGMLNEEVLLME